MYSTFVDPVGLSEDYCLDTLKYLLPEVTSKLYIDAFKDEDELLRLHGKVIFADFRFPKLGNDATSV